MSGFVWMLSGLAIGLFIAFLVYLDKQPPTDISFSDAVKTELDRIKQHNTNTSAKPETPAQQEPKFNFYTILPELEVLIPEDEIRPPASKKTPSRVDSKRYILQAGSFRNRQDAEKLKATVALLGLEASINQVSIENEQWHRVRIGPVNSRRELNHNLNLLQHNNINAMAMELK
ncbi:MAG: SPOR domain-containing protein [Gammaproteobacteria bacterium]|nr:SPOR domain-containing protein [Gammaproteobacteria bacterium]